MIMFLDEKNARALVDLKTATVKYSQRVATAENFIQIAYEGETLLMAFESVIEFDKWTLGFRRQQQLINDMTRGSMLEPSNNMMLNESMTMAAHVGAGPIKVLDDDLKSMVAQAPKPKIHKFPTNFSNDQEIQSAKKRL
jgi:hypothetical protein